MVQKVFLAIPTHSGDIRVGTFMAVLNATSKAIWRGVTVEVHCWEGDSLIPNARNVLFAAFRATDCTDLVFLDADIGFDNDGFFRLLSHPVDIVGGAYRFKKDKEDYPVDWLPDDGNGLWSDENGLISVGGMPTGFLRITRDAADKLAAAYDDRQYRSHLAPELSVHCLFDLVLENGVYHGEDYAFCKKWRDIGGKVFLDPMIKLDHCGTKIFKGDVGHWLRHRNDPEYKFDDLRRVFGSPEMLRLMDEATGEAA
jgi:glycosyltransferase involved in cell wall biosynthesis